MGRLVGIMLFLWKPFWVFGMLPLGIWARLSEVLEVLSRLPVKSVRLPKPFPKELKPKFVPELVVSISFLTPVRTKHVGNIERAACKSSRLLPQEVKASQNESIQCCALGNIALEQYLLCYHQ